MKSRRLVVSLPGRDVGKLEQTRNGKARWTPDETWEMEGQMPRLGLGFLRRRGRRTLATDLPPWFDNLLPEKGSTLRRRMAEAHGLREGQSFELLRALGSDLTGAVEVRPEDRHASALGAAAGSALPQDAGEPGEEDPSIRLSALTGMQLKFSMSMVHERLTLPARGRGGQWIVKLAGPDYPELAEVEAATMTWAKAAGFDVPQHFVVPFDRLDGLPVGWADGEAPAFAVRRFDRRDDGSKVHQEDLCQALDLRPGNKYGLTSPTVGFEAVLRLVCDACGDVEGRKIARRLGFMIVSGNSDAHLKNWGLLWGEHVGPTLAPCYDLVTTIAWDRLGWQRARGPELALRFGGERLFRRVDDQSLVKFEKEAGIPWARQEVLAGITSGRDCWAAIADKAPMRMRQALETHWKSVPLLAARA